MSTKNQEKPKKPNQNKTKKKNPNKTNYKQKRKTPPQTTSTPARKKSTPTPPKQKNNKKTPIQNKTKKPTKTNARCNLYFLLRFGPLLFRNLCRVCVNHPLSTLHIVLLLIVYYMKDILIPRGIQNEDVSQRLKLPAAVPAVIAPVTNINASNQSNSEADRSGDKSNRAGKRGCSNATVAIIYLYGESSAHALLYFNNLKIKCCLSF